jgi:L-aminopeptidase/D-esterase-like protein
MMTEAATEAQTIMATTGADIFGAVPGRTNSLADVPGISVGHAPARAGDPVSSGATVVACPAGAVAAVDVRGGGPGTRETDLLEPSNSVQAVHAVTLCGGSAFGLDAAGGVMAGLEDRGIGLRVLGDGGPLVPIVPAAVIFDLVLGDPRSRPDAATGRAALDAALDGTSDAALDGTPDGASGTDPSAAAHGVGLGASAGALKGGFGEASAVVTPAPGARDRTVAVGLVVNAAGSVVDPSTGELWGWGARLGTEMDRHGLPGRATPRGLADLLARRIGGTKIPPGQETSLNTTIGVVATDAPVTKAQAQRLAMAAHDGLARAVRPAHLPMDGDTFFALSPVPPAGTADSGEAQLPRSGVSDAELAVLSAMAATCTERAVVHAVLAADSAFGVPSWREVTAP